MALSTTLYMPLCLEYHAECHDLCIVCCMSLCLVSLRWMSLCWRSWRRFCCWTYQYNKRLVDTM